MDDFDPSSPLNQKLDYIIKRLDENQKILKSLHTSMIWGRAFRIVYWTILIGGAIGAFYFLQPYLETLMGVYGDVQNVQGDISDLLQ